MMEPSLDPAVRSLHRRLGAIGAQPVPDGEEALARLLPQLSDHRLEARVQAPPSATARRSRRSMRRVLAIAAVIVMLGGSAFATVGGPARSVFTGLFGRRPETASPRPAPAGDAGRANAGMGGEHGGHVHSPGASGPHQGSGPGDLSTGQGQAGQSSQDEETDQNQGENQDEQGSGGDEGPIGGDGNAGGDEQGSDDADQSTSDENTSDQGAGQGDGDQSGTGSGSADSRS